MSRKVLSNGVQTPLADMSSRAWSPVIVLGLRHGSHPHLPSVAGAQLSHHDIPHEVDLPMFL